MNDTSTRNWTDAQDALAYDTFKTLAHNEGVAHATEIMHNIQAMGADFLDCDIQAWVDRFNDEEMPPRGQVLNGISFERETVDETSFRITTPSYHGSATEVREGLVRWQVVQRGTNWPEGHGEAASKDEALRQMTKVMSDNS